VATEADAIRIAEAALVARYRSVGEGLETFAASADDHWDIFQGVMIDEPRLDGGMNGWVLEDGHTFNIAKCGGEVSGLDGP
jgi:hypothetical protein